MPSSLLQRNGEILSVYRSLQVWGIYQLTKNIFNTEKNGMKKKTTDRSTTYDGVCEKAVFSLRSSTLWHAYTVWYCFWEGRKNDPV